MDERIITEIFRRFDRNKDGIISREELLAVFDKILPGAKDMDRLIQQMDTNHDGQIQYEEFVVWILGAGNGDAYAKDRSSLLNAHAQAAHQKVLLQRQPGSSTFRAACVGLRVERLRESQTGVKRTALFWGQLSSEQGRASLATLRSDPPRGALAVVCAAHSLLRVSSKKIHWEEAEAMLEDVDAFLMELKDYNPYRVPAYVVQSFEENLTLPYFDYKRMEERNYACACLGSWVIAAVRSWREAKQMVPVEDAALRADAAVAEVKQKQT
ncbi:Calmodulin-4 (Calcium-binding protein Dd112) [Durusdinium trenchii]|uniref:Calmodulin-4 (Calcium-binding protein Dd112) n=1 Tax=Durusdinium trenchii TaxID=1381693 RepID=A0ABP0JXV9_9DINO